jgi:hypothetical protein
MDDLRSISLVTKAHVQNRENSELAAVKKLDLALGMPDSLKGPLLLASSRKEGFLMSNRVAGGVAFMKKIGKLRPH